MNESLEIISTIDQLRQLLPSIDDARAEDMRSVTEKYTFRLPRYYVQHVLRNDVADPLWDLALPGRAELYDAGDERWDTYQIAERAVDHPRWIQKYKYEALLRMTDFCSGLCRYCYLKNRDVTPGHITHQELNAMFDAVEASPFRGNLRELVLSGGDPLTVPAETVEHLAERMERLNRLVTRRITVTVHTREPTWYPQRLMRNKAMQAALRRLAPSSYILHVVHPREVTAGLLDSLVLLSELAARRRPLMLLQHPLFRGINNDAKVITEMYDRLDSGEVVVKPYYLIHPFPDGTLPQHRLTLPESQAILRDLASAPGTRVPMLTVPTPMGKCVIGPYEVLTDQGGYYLLHTKDGVPVEYNTGQHYDPRERRAHIPIMPRVSKSAQ